MQQVQASCRLLNPTGRQHQKSTHSQWWVDFCDGGLEFGIVGGLFSLQVPSIPKITKAMPEVYPVTFQVHTLNWQRVSADDIPPESGLYQIYGDSNIYGRNVLLYIGMSKNLKSRVEEQLDPQEMIGRQPNLSVRIARVPSGHLAILESILIAMHKPAFNSATLKGPSKAAKAAPILIRNHANRGALMLEVTNSYFLEPGLVGWRVQ